MLYGKEGTLFLDLDAKKLFLTRKDGGAQQTEITISQDKKESWKVSRSLLSEQHRGPVKCVSDLMSQGKERICLREYRDNSPATYAPSECILSACNSKTCKEGPHLSHMTSALLVFL